MYFATEVLPGEECIISGSENEPLIIRSLDGDLITTVLPEGSWTHEKLMSVDLSDLDLTQGADAFLGDQWVGSTEC